MLDTGHLTLEPDFSFLRKSSLLQDFDQTPSSEEAGIRAKISLLM